MDHRANRMRTHAGGGPKSRRVLSKKVQFALALLGAVLFLLFTYRVLSREIVRAPPEPEVVTSCPLAAVDWSTFLHPGDTPKGIAAIFTYNYTDLSLLWLIQGLHSIQYEVELLVLPQQAADAKQLLRQVQARSEGMGQVGSVRIRMTKLKGYTLTGPTCKVFVHVCDDYMPQVLGKGTSNTVIMRPPQTSLPGLQRNHSTSTSSAATATGTISADHETQLMASYDFMVYTSTTAFVQHNPVVLPVFERLQSINRLFPLLDIISFPAVPAANSTDQALAQPAGVTISMSKYLPDKRTLLASALTAFQKLHKAVPKLVRLVICTYLMPGIAEDLPWLTGQISELGLSEVYELRHDALDSGSQFEGIRVQWHLYNQDAKPHFTAIAGMPAGIWVLDCSGVLSTTPDVVFGPCSNTSQLTQLTNDFLKQPHKVQRKELARVTQHSLKTVATMFNSKLFQMVHRSFLSKVARFFMQSSLAAYKARITPAVQQFRAEKAKVTTDEKQYAAVIVEARPHYAFLYTVLNAAWYLPGWKMHVVHTRMNANFVQKILEPYLDVTYHLLDVDNIDIDEYNGLMKNSSFWQMLEADVVMLFQTDSLILRHGLEAFSHFAYIGAPWHQENERWSQPALREALPGGVGNGGFSMRSIAAMVELCDQYSATSALKEQEDVFFAVKIQAHDVYELADRQSAYTFCLEVPCKDLPATHPYGIHAAWYYNDLPTMQQLLDSSLFDLDEHDCALPISSS